MNVGVEKGVVLRQAVARRAPRRALGPGAYCGYSAVLIGAEPAEVGGTLVSLEARLWQRGCGPSRRPTSWA